MAIEESMNAIASILRSVLLGTGLGFGMLCILATVGLANGWDLREMVVLALPLPFGPLASLLLLGMAANVPTR